jgi:hypothetical protein
MRQNVLYRKVAAGLFLGALITFFFARCLPEPLEVNGLPVVKPQIVVSTQIIPDQTLAVLLTKTFGALDANGDSEPSALFSQIAVSDAVVTIEGEDGTDTLLAISEGVYGGVSIPFEEGQRYTLHVQSQSLGEVSATTTVMRRVAFDAIDAKLYFNGFDDSLAQITYRITDPPETNWYMLNVQEVERADLVENLLNPRAFTRLIADEGFASQSYEESFLVVPRDFSAGDTIAVSLSSVTQEYFQFLKLRQENRFSFIEYLSEPVNYPSNVVGGKGYFNLYVPDFRIFVLE